MKNNNYPTWLVPIEIAKELKEIGFNEPCIFSYSEGIGITACLRYGSGEEPYISDFIVGGNTPNSPYIDLPTYEQVFEWFREKGLYSFLRVNIPDLSVSYFIYDKDGYIEENGHRNTYKDAQNDCVEELIKIYKEHE
ncbi:hypothetical protein [Capnocytophaga granulosa]|uniref:hypothetical protein n=1 Tax=Capnocytophaga granulosa TaxID=45242 RepID=UPI002049FA43|nr:hypothetical protein [Capnocytophaga granulosa]DAY22095.1 MAG TPA: hypothetical protein [Caudoviricetes sp.]